MKCPGSILLTIIFSTSIYSQISNIEYIQGSTAKISQLVGDYDRQWEVQTLNLTESKYGLTSTDLGVPFQHNGRTYLLFGDSWGGPIGDAIAYTNDSDPEDGITLDFITDESGIYKAVKIPGISQEEYEVPMEGVSIDGKMYTYHTTDHSSTVVMGRSVVAVTKDDGQTFNFLYDLSKKHFINVSIVNVNLEEWQGFPLGYGDGLVLFGSGTYRKSDVRLAFQPAGQIENPQSLRYFAGVDQDGVPFWSENEDDSIPLFSHPCVGELSVTYNQYIRKWLMLYNGDPPRGINFRTADAPWGPWSEPQLLFDPWLDNGYCHFMHVNWQFRVCDSVHDPGRENEWGGEYGPYQFETLATGNDSTTTIYYTLSTWNPYTIVLMKSTLKLLNSPTSITTENPMPILPMGFHLESNYPNPFNHSTTISYQVANLAFIKLKIYNSNGQLIRTLVNSLKAPGKYSVQFSAYNIASGIYFYQLELDSQKSEIIKMAYIP
ncbi:DUF4185 domain-containing protein [candidate division KSB1 bacterium]|nr:DUF4185 domain-containing protein [candidate division KSB1 bacterium]